MSAASSPYGKPPEQAGRDRSHRQRTARLRIYRHHILRLRVVQPLKDSKGKTWTETTQTESTANGFVSGHLLATTDRWQRPTFTSRGSSLHGPQCLGVGVASILAFDGEKARCPQARQNRAQPGTVTHVAGQRPCSQFKASTAMTDTITVDSPFTIPTRPWANGSNFGGALAYEIQTTATARNPAWHFSSVLPRPFMASKKAAGGGSASVGDVSVHARGLHLHSATGALPIRRAA